MIENDRKLQEGRYRYYLPMRPPSLGTQPRGQVRAFAYEERSPVEGVERDVWGYVEYDHPLTTQEQQQYELIPSPMNPDAQPEG